MGIYFTQKGDFKETENFLKKALKFNIRDILNAYGEAGVLMLQDSTPVDTGKTRDSWYYRVKKEPGVWKVIWCNRNVVNAHSRSKEHVNVAVILQYGHATRQGGYVEGIDYINPALKPVFDRIANEAYERMVSYYGGN